MALFGKKNSIPNTPLNQTSAPITDAEDFFKDMGRKKKPVKDTFDIDLPIITGLHDEPLPAPGSTIKNADSVDTDGLRDKSGDGPDPLHARIREFKEEIDTTVIPKEEKIYRSEKVITADDFFRDLDRKRAPKIDIDVPEITGLREAPEAHHISDIGDADPDEDAVEALADKTHEVGNFVHGDISVVDIGSIDLSSLRPESE